jgi:hypothetical protein
MSGPSEMMVRPRHDSPSQWLDRAASLFGGKSRRECGDSPGLRGWTGSKQTNRSHATSSRPVTCRCPGANHVPQPVVCRLDTPVVARRRTSLLGGHPPTVVGRNPVRAAWRSLCRVGCHPVGREVRSSARRVARHESIWHRRAPLALRGNRSRLHAQTKGTAWFPGALPRS